MKAFGLINLGVLPLLLEAMTPVYAQHDQREHESRQLQQEHESRQERQPQQAKPERQERPKESRPEKQPQPRSAAQEAPRRTQESSPSRRPQPANPVHPAAPQRARGEQERQPPHAKAPQEQRRPAAATAKPEQKQRQQQTQRPLPQAQREYETQHRGALIDRRAHNWKSEHRTWQDRGGYSGYRIPDARFRGHFGARHSFRMFSYPLVMVGGYPRFQYEGYWFSVMDPWPEYWSDGWYGSDDLYIEYYGGGYYMRNRRHPMDRIALTVFVN